jgi:hypothetical protein
VHLHRTPEPCDTCHEWPDWARHINAAVNHLAEQQERIMSDQDQLNTDVAALTAAETGIVNEIAGLKAQIAAGTPAAALDFTALDAVTSRLTADVPAPAAPVAAPPATPAA